jgi:hypothetical protein
VLITPFWMMAAGVFRKPDMPYTTKVNTREEMIWKGVQAVICKHTTDKLHSVLGWCLAMALAVQRREIGICAYAGSISLQVQHAKYDVQNQSHTKKELMMH